MLSRDRLLLSKGIGVVVERGEIRGDRLLLSEARQVVVE